MQRLELGDHPLPPQLESFLDIENVTRLAFSADLVHLAVLGSSGTLRLWHLPTGKLLRWWCDGRYRGAPGALAFSPDGSLLAASGTFGFAIWELTDLEEPLLEDTSNMPHCVVFHPDGSYLTFNRPEGLQRRKPPNWEALPGAWCGTTKHGWHLEAWAFSADGAWIAVVRHSYLRVLPHIPSLLGMYDARIGELRRERHLSMKPPLSAALTSDGTHLLGIVKAGIQVWDTMTGEPLRFFKGGRRHLYALALSVDERLVAAISKTEEVVRIWEVATGRLVSEYNFGLGKLFCVAFAPDGRRAAVGGEKACVVWGVEEGTR